jgi:hypothetical protein
MDSLEAALAAYSLLRNTEVTDRLGLNPARASRLGLALVVGTELASKLALDLLARHAQSINDFERQEQYATAELGYEDGKPVLIYEITEGTRRCLKLLGALRVIAAADPGALRAA